MFDLIIAYLVITFLVNTAKTVKGQPKKGTENQKKIDAGKQTGKYAPYGNKRLPQKKQSEPVPARKRPVSQPAKAAGPSVVCADGRRDKSCSQPVTVSADKGTKVTRQPIPVTKIAAVSGEEERLQEILEPTEEHILTGLIWSDILGPPVSKRPRRY